MGCHHKFFFTHPTSSIIPCTPENGWANQVTNPSTWKELSLKYEQL